MHFRNLSQQPETERQTESDVKQSKVYFNYRRKNRFTKRTTRKRNNEQNEQPINFFDKTLQEEYNKGNIFSDIYYTSSKVTTTRPDLHGKINEDE